MFMLKIKQYMSIFYPAHFKKLKKLKKPTRLYAKMYHFKQQNQNLSNSFLVKSRRNRLGCLLNEMVHIRGIVLLF